MKAVVYTRYGSPNVLRFMDVEKPAPKRTFRDGSVELLVLLRHCSRLTWLHARRYGAARFPHAGLIPWRVMDGGRTSQPPCDHIHAWA
jgi:hypothetical protein